MKVERVQLVGIIAVAMTVSSCFATEDVPSYELDSVILIDGGNAGRYTNVKIGRDGVPLVVYNQGGATNAVKAAHCSDPTCSTFTTHVVESGSTGDFGRFINMIMGPDGLPWISYTGVGATLRFARCEDEQCKKVTTHQIDGSHAAYPSIAVRNNKPVVAYFHSTGLKLATCQDTACHKVSTLVVDNKSGTGKYPSVDVNGNNDIGISYGDDRGGQLMFAFCPDGDCSSAHTQVVDDSTKDVGSFTSMKWNRLDLPTMMYTDQIHGFVKVAACEDEQCSKVETAVIDHIGVYPYGVFPEMDLSPVSKFPVLTYFNQTSKSSGSLKLAICTDDSCQGKVKVMDVSDGKCGYGRDSSMAWGADGSFYVSFLDYNGGSTKKTRLAVMHECTNESCGANEDEMSHQLESTIYSSVSRRFLKSVDIC